jgi:hypothetical protein
MMETQATTHCCLEPFRWKSLCGWDFRPQLIVVSGLFGGNPFVDGILGHNLLLSQAFSVGIPSWMGFRLSRNHFHNLLFFSQWNCGYQEALHTDFFLFHDGILATRKPFSQTFSFVTMEFRLSGSLSHELFLFSRWNSGYQEAFLRNFFFFHDGILAIRKPFSRTFSFFTMQFWLSGSLSHELFLFS